ncbi:MAG TPA: TMEM43 family protein [Thermoanaerobaculia bacterium]|nr:TMEM43 family protein [Thermoanaerobaculia bacterium]
MDGNSFTETTGQSWGSRLIESIKGVLFGLLLVIAAFVLLFWNEGRSVRRAKSLTEGAHAVVSVPANRVDSANGGKLVHVSGEATTTETLSDPEFGVSVSAIKLERYAEMYQWKETRSSKSKSKLGGGKKTVTTYSYSKVWSPALIDSSSFKNPQGHENPGAMVVAGKTWTANNVTLGAFSLSSAQVAKLNRTDDLSVDENAAAALPAATKARFHWSDGGFYAGSNPASPAIGDTRVTFKVVRPATVSVVGRQIGRSFEPYQAKAGGSILLLSYGTASAGSMFKSAEKSNEKLAWILRLVGFVGMALGFFLIFKPLEVVADVLPILGTFVGIGAGLFAIILAACFSILTIALAWLAFRPLVGIPLLIVVVAGFVWLIRLGLKKKRQRTAAPTSAT